MQGSDSSLKEVIDNFKFTVSILMVWAAIFIISRCSPKESINAQEIKSDYLYEERTSEWMI